jgi:hypothetical protein
VVFVSAARLGALLCFVFFGVAMIVSSAGWWLVQA